MISESYSLNKGIILEGEEGLRFSESNPLKKSIKGSPPQKGAKTGAVPQGLAMSVDLRKKAKKGIDTMGIESVAPSVLGVVNYVNGKKKATMMERARELEKQQKLQNLKVR